MTLTAPLLRPANPRFSSGPRRDIASWNLQSLEGAYVGRSHRGEGGRAKLKSAIDLTAEILGVPAGYRVAIVPGSDTGAMELALWSLLVRAALMCSPGKLSVRSGPRISSSI